MRFSVALRNSIWLAVLCLSAQEQKPPGKDALTNEAKGLAPRGAPANYQAQAKAGTVTIGAEFMRHAVPTALGTLSTEDYVVVELGMFAAPGERTKLSITDFSLRINGKKPLPTQPYGMVLANVKDPEWEPPEPPKPKGGGLSTGGDSGGAQGEPPHAPPKMPMPLQHAMQQKVQKAALPEGDRALPQAGLLFFSYHGRSEGIKSVVLMYTGPAGKTTLTLQP